MKFYLFFIILLFQFCYSQYYYDQCIATQMIGFNDTDFYESPQDINLRYCPESSGNSCCTREYSDEIGDYSDPFSLSFLDIIASPVQECREKLDTISCIMCSTSQSDWIFININGDFSSLIMCLSYCEDLYDSCSDDMTIFGESVQEHYNSPPQFCTALFDTISHSDSTVKVLIDTHNAYCWDNLPECTSDSYYYIYTDCVDERRNKIWLQKPEVECAGGVPIPDNEPDLPCALTCGPGYRTGQTSCVECPRGEYSIGGSIILDSWNPDKITLPLTTYCTWTDIYGVERIWTDDSCNGWQRQFGMMSSPPGLNDSMSAYLETSFTLVEDGELKFTAVVPSEPNFDGLKVFVDRIESEEVGFVTHTTSFKDYTIPLSMGYHFIQFVYIKDFSVSVGLDQASINRLEISNIDYASDYCTPCPPGSYSPDRGSSSCTLCELNTYMDEYGHSSCLPCPSTTYSYAGSTNCTDKPDCTEDSYYYRYGECFYDEYYDKGRREYYPQWVEPHICNSDELPPGTYVDCPPCEPGMETLEDSITCEFCESGFYSPGDNEPCRGCAAGYEAPRSLTFDEFNDFAYGLSTSCQYDCFSDGWVLREDKIDSGTGHGAYVISILTLNQTFVSDGMITFDYALICEKPCLMTFQPDNGETLYRAYGGEYIFQSSNYTKHYSIPAGDHSFTWIFTRDDSSEEAINDRAEIYKISLSNVGVGGATECTPCKPGFYNPTENSAECIPAELGKYAPGGTEYSYNCENNTYSDELGLSSCKSCGENVLTTNDNTACNVTCMYTIDTLTYDLSNLARNDSEMYGPVWDISSNHTYYLNMCDKQHNEHICFDINGDPLETYACQVTDIGLGEDLGSTFGIMSLRDNPSNTLGVTVHLTNGDQCHNGTKYFNRQAYIDIICDPSGGIGEPVPLYDTVETEKCVYQFTWNSLYGCPLCSEEHYHYIASECDQNGNTTLIYEWNSNPKNCHHGVELPEPETVPCPNIYCGPGEYYDSDTGNCAMAPRGYYSVGNGFKISSWLELEDGFTNNGWIGTENYIYSGEGDTSLIYVQNFVREGQVIFTYLVNNYGDSTAGFTYYIDDILQETEIYSTQNEYKYASFTVPSGYHYIKFQFEGGTSTTSNARAIRVKIQEMTILGTKWAANYPIPCPAGTYSSIPRSTECKDCQWNSYSTTGSYHCIGCPDDSYAFPGSETCTPKEPCSLSDYYLTYTACYDNQQLPYYVLMEPAICLQTELPEPADDTIECFPCEHGSYREDNSDSCVQCSKGKYWNESSSKCKSASKGSAAILYTSYFQSPMNGTSFPDEFSTGCSGDCFCLNSLCNTDGWRFRSSYVDSGMNDDREVDTHLDLHLTLINDGSISFTYQVTGHANNGLEFFINDKQLNVPYHPFSNKKSESDTHVSFDVEKGDNVFRWNYHQEPNTMGSVIISLIDIEGLGGATEAIPCPPGEYNEESGLSECLLCPEGTASSEEGSTSCNMCPSNSYTIDEGSSECIECGSQTTANDDRTDCETDCIFTFGNNTYDLTNLANSHGPYPIDENGSTGIWINLCEKRTSSSICIDQYGDPIKTYMCEIDTRGNGIDYGNHLSVDLVEVDDTDDKAVRMSYTVEDDDEGNFCQSTITIVCDPDSSIQIPYVVGNPTDCDLHLRWNSEYGCPVCDNDVDYRRQESECSGGERTITYVKASNCNGLSILKVETESCPTRYSFSLAVIIIVIIILLILCVAVIGVLVYNRRLHSQYVALIEESEGQYEMDEIEDSSVVDDNNTETEEDV